MGFSDFLFGTPEKNERFSTLRPDQESLFKQLLASLQGEGVGGAFGSTSDFFRDLLNPNGQNFNALQAPELRQFNEQIIPNLAEQFAGLGFNGSGLSSSGFRNAAINAGTDLSERLGALRANLRQQGAQGLQSLASQGLGNFSERVVTRPGTGGFLSQVAPLVGSALGGFGGTLGNITGNFLKNKFSR